uniref:Uncharacterized protein n=1 Tax=Chelydra serpentina TaxID=8475 RepID=A0A8C3S4I4_CHESE
KKCCLRHLEETVYKIMEGMGIPWIYIWVFDYPWAADVGIAFELLEEGVWNCSERYSHKQGCESDMQIAQLNALMNMLVMTICTIDIHARDVVPKLRAKKISTGQAFTLLSQLCHRWDEDQGDCLVNICDAQFVCDYHPLANDSYQEPVEHPWDCWPASPPPTPFPHIEHHRQKHSWRHTGSVQECCFSI